MEKHFMVDIEATGIDPAKEDLLQIGILEVDLQQGYWVPGRKAVWWQHTDRKPESQFAKEHMAAIYEACNKVHWVDPKDMRQSINDFFTQCGAGGPDTYLMGWNASNFDVPFLIHKGVIKPSDYETIDGKDFRVGDFHYRIYELGGAVSLAQNALSLTDRSLLCDKARDAGAVVGGFEMPEGKAHDALYDCYSQLRLLNGLIFLMRNA